MNQYFEKKIILLAMAMGAYATQAAADDTRVLSHERGLWRAEIDAAAGFTIEDILHEEPLVRFELDGVVEPDILVDPELGIDATDIVGPRQLWFSTDAGLEHIIEVFEPTIPLRQRLWVDGLVPHVDDAGVTLVDAAGVPRATYTKLHVFDAAGVVHPAWFEGDGDAIDIHVETTESTVWPVVIDPLANVVVTINSVCSSSRTACSNANRFGRSVAVGQLFYDERPELVVGAPFHTSGPAVAEGAIAIFTPDINGTLVFEDFRSMNGVELNGAMCGHSVAIGDVIGGLPNDIVIGCPGAFGDPGAVLIYENLGASLKTTVDGPLTHSFGEVRAADYAGLGTIDLGFAKRSIVATSSSRLLLWTTPTSSVTVVGTYPVTVEPHLDVGVINGGDDVVVGTSAGIAAFDNESSSSTLLPLPSHSFATASGSVAGNRVALGRFSTPGTGLSDLAVGQPDFNSGDGRIVVYSGISNWTTVQTSLWATAPGERLGESLAAFDLNADRFDDLVSCGRGTSTVAKCQAWGGSPLSGLVTSARMSITTGGNIGTGMTVPAAGDFLGDGAADLILGQHLASGAIGTVTKQEGTRAGLDTNSFKRLRGAGTNAAIGQGALIVADVNQDGLDDVIVNESGNGAFGAVQVFLGRPYMDLTPDWTLLGQSGRSGVGARGIAVGRFRGPTQPPSIAVTSSAGILIFHATVGGVPATANVYAPSQMINEPEAASIVAGGSVIGTLGESLVVGVPDKAGAGKVKLYISQGSAGLITSPWQTVSEPIGGCPTTSQFGTMVAVVGDVDGNGRDDVMVTAPDCAAGGTLRGRGILLPALNGDFVSTAAAWTFSGTLDNDRISTAAGIGDVNDDNCDDFALGSPDHNGGRGRVWFFHGSCSGLPSMTQAMFHTGGTFNGAGSRFGISIAGGEDFNLDGTDDVVIGAPRYANTTAALDAGRIYVYHGSSDGIGPWTTTSTGTGTDHRVGTHVAVGRINTGSSFPDSRYGDIAFSMPGAEDVNSNEGVVRIRVGRW